ncbi:GlpM family protein, partial [Pseudomonas aeruginosa]|nr:GlpM family protein [Pseudomonas aeruginosa]
LAQQTLKEVERFAQFTFIKACLITGGEDFKVQGARLRKNPEIIIGTPGRLLEQRNAGNLPLQDIEVLVLDEADRMLDMGFADDVLALANACPAERQTLLFSATHSGAGLNKVIAEVLREPQVLRLNQVGELNENVRQQVITADDVAHKEQLLQWLLSNETYTKAIVFTNTRVSADRLTGRLIANQHKVFVLHGEKDQKDRKLAIERLKQGAVKILVATDVAARGLDVEGLDLVINFDMPRSGDEYVHRIGRTGRAGAEGLAISLICHGDWNLMSSVERYLKQNFERRNIKELKAAYQGPKKLKASGKAAGSKKKKQDRKGAAAVENPVDLMFKALIGAAVVVLLAVLSKTRNYYIAGLVPLFPTFALIAHYIVGKGRSLDDLKTTIVFGMWSIIPYFVYLAALYLLVERFRLETSLALAALAWLVAASVLVGLWV